MKLDDYIGETTSYDKKLMLERKDPTSWLKSVSAFANTQGGRLLFGVANDGALCGLADAQDDSEFISETIKMQMDPDLFQRLDLMERRGSGFKKILDAYAFESEKRGEVVTPRFESTSTDFFLVLPNLNYGKVINGVESSSAGLDTEIATEVNGGKTGMKTGMTAGMKTADAIVALIAENPTISHDSLAEKLGRARSTIIEQIAKLKANGRIRRVGPDKGGHWEVID